MTRRGSDKLAHLRKRDVTTDHLERLAALADADGIDLLDWREKGTPAIDMATATFAARPRSAGALIDRLLETPAIRRIEVFPFGVVAIDRVHIQAATEQQR